MLPLHVQRDGGFVAEEFDETLTGLTKEQSNANGQQNKERDLTFSSHNPVTLKRFSTLGHTETILTVEGSATPVCFHMFKCSSRLVRFTTQ